MKNRDVVSGVGKDAKRTDLNPSNLVSERVKKLQREAKVQNATGGAYSQRTQLQNIDSFLDLMQLPLKEAWGIEQRLAKLIETALEL